MRKPWAIRQIVTGEWKQWPVQVTHTRPRGIFIRPKLSEKKNQSDPKCIEAS